MRAFISLTSVVSFPLFEPTSGVFLCSGFFLCTQAAHRPFPLQSLAFLSDLLLSSLLWAVFIGLLIPLSKACFRATRSDRPSLQGCEVYQHGLGLLLPKAVVLRPLDLSHPAVFQLLALNLTSTCLTEKG